MITYLLIGFFSAISLSGLLLNNTFNTHNKRINEMLKHQLESLHNSLENTDVENDIKTSVNSVYELSKLII